MTHTKHPFITVLLIVTLFALPLSLAYWFYFRHDTAGEGYTNRGDLITPPFRISRLKLQEPNGKPFAKAKQKKWMMLFFYPKACQKQCEMGLYAMRQIRTATGKNRDRIARALLTYSNTAGSPLNHLLDQPFKGTLHLIAKKKNLQTQLQQHVHQPYSLTPGTLYLVDPLGNVMMSYKPGTLPENILKDLKLLLKVSQIG